MLALPRSVTSLEPFQNSWTPRTVTAGEATEEEAIPRADINYHPHLSKRAEMVQGLCIASAYSAFPELRQHEWPALTTRP